MSLETKEQTEAREASERKWSEEWEGGRPGRSMGTESCRDGHSRDSGDLSLRWHTLNKPKGEESLSIAALGLTV